MELLENQWEAEMFDVDKSNGMRKATSTIDEKYLKKVGALMVSTMLLLSPLKAKAEELINTGYSDFEMKAYSPAELVRSTSSKTSAEIVCLRYNLFIYN